MKALIIGATGATGLDLIQQMIDDSDYSEIHLFVRRTPQFEHPKLNIHLVDFNTPEQWSNLVKGDVAYSCMGTTLKDAGTKENQWKIDYSYQLEFAQNCKANGVGSFVLVSSAYASPKSSFFYPRMKGELEDQIKIIGFNKLLIFNPPSLVRKNSSRFYENLSVAVIRFFNKLGLFKKLKPLPTNLLAKSMVQLDKFYTKGFYQFQTKDIWDSLK